MVQKFILGCGALRGLPLEIFRIKRRNLRNVADVPAPVGNCLARFD